MSTIIETIRTVRFWESPTLEDPGEAQIGNLLLDSGGSPVSITRQVPAWNHRLRIGARFALTGDSTGNIANTGFGFGLCAGHARRLGQAGAYYVGVLGENLLGTFERVTSTGTSPPSQTSRWLRLHWIKRVDAATNTTLSVGGQTFRFPRFETLWAINPIDPTHAGFTMMSLIIEFTKAAPPSSWGLGLCQDFFSRIAASKEWFREGVTAPWGLTSNRNPLRNERLWLGHTTDGSHVSSGSGVIDEATFGLMDHVNIFWQCPVAVKLMVADFWVTADTSTFEF
jgi:hypothetical protein